MSLESCHCGQVHMERDTWRSNTWSWWFDGKGHGPTACIKPEAVALKDDIVRLQNRITAAICANALAAARAEVSHEHAIAVGEAEHRGEVERASQEAAMLWGRERDALQARVKTLETALLDLMEALPPNTAWLNAMRNAMAVMTGFKRYPREGEE